MERQKETYKVYEQVEVLHGDKWVWGRIISMTTVEGAELYCVSIDDRTFVQVKANEIRKPIRNRLFSKAERSTFKYWFAHWCAFQMTALNLKAWKFKYLFHDLEKPWLLLLWRDYKRVQQYHRTHSRHHLEYSNFKKMDWQAMMIDWECSRFTKESSPLTARQEVERCRLQGAYRRGAEQALRELGL